LARPGGQVVLFGGCPSGTEARFDTARLHYDQVRVLSPFHFAPRDVRSAYELLGDERFDGSSLIARPYPLSELAIALERLRVGEGPKFAIIPNGA
jgi:L-iditol 2-dehydrogenase